MHYADFAEDESAALLSAIKDYEANKWKVIGQKVGKPAKVTWIIILASESFRHESAPADISRPANSMPKSTFHDEA